jgi:hypothetical protein
MERFLDRLSLSEYKEQFILKGALMLRVWGASQVRPTMDIDMLGITSNDSEKIVTQFQQIISLVIAERAGDALHARLGHHSTLWIPDILLIFVRI